MTAIPSRFTLFLFLVISLLPLAPLDSQVSPATPAPAILATATSLPTITPPRPSPSPGPTTFVGNLLEARERANVRSEPDVSSDLLGEIVAGERYLVLGRFFRWLQFEYRFGPAWVFEELVIIHGDAVEIPEIDLFAALTTADPELAATLAIITQTPGGLQTATAQAQFIPAPATSLPSRVTDAEDINILPTYTFPPQFDVENNRPDAALRVTPALLPRTSAMLSEFPPIIPIAILAGLGLLGLLIATLRR